MNGMPPSWQEMLQSATAPSQIVALANEFLGRVEPVTIVALPNTCKIRMMQSAADVNAYAVDLKTCRCADLREAQAVERVMTFFQEACQRLAVVTGPQPRPNDDLWASYGITSRVADGAED